MRKITKYYFNYFHLLYLHWNSSYCTSSTKTTSPLVMNSRSDLNVSNPSFRGWLTVTLSTTELEPMSIVIGQSLKKTRRSNFQKIISFFFILREMIDTGSCVVNENWKCVNHLQGVSGIQINIILRSMVFTYISKFIVRCQEYWIYTGCPRKIHSHLGKGRTTPKWTL